MMLILLLLAVILLVLVEGFFSGSETVYTSTSKAFIHRLADEGDPRARRIREMLAKTERFLGTTLTGTNLALVSSTTLCQIIVARYVLSNEGVRHLIAMIPAPWNWEYILNTVIMTPIILILAELVPKSIARSHADTLALKLVDPLLFAGKVLSPLVWVLSRVVDRLAGWLGGSSHGAFVPSVTRDDLKAMAELAAEQGIVPETAASMLRTVFDLDRKPVSTMMVPLVDVASVSLEATLDDVGRLAAETGFARFPVYHERVDEIVGIVSLRHLLYECDPEGEPLSPDAPIAPYVLRHITFVPESKPVGTLLHELRYQHIPMAVVVDEHGGVVGILTLEDLVEEVVGDIQDERDRPVSEVTVLADDVFDCDGKLSIEDLEEHLGIEIPRDGFETVAGLVLKLCGRIPQPRDHIRFGGYDIEVLDVVKHKVTRLRFRRQNRNGNA